MSANAPRFTGYTRPDGVVPTARSWRTILRYWEGFTFTGHGAYEYLLDKVKFGNSRMYETFLEMYTPSLSRMFDQSRAHPYGRQVIRDKPDLLALLSDDDYLASLPVGSLGHAYRSFLTTNRLDAGVFDEATVIRPLAESRNWHEDFYYFVVRYTVMHDLLHVVTGYGADMPGEILAIGFQAGQSEPAGPFGKIGYALAAWVPGASLRHKLRAYREAVERGRRADRLSATPWEELLDEPLEDVRSQLGIAPVRAAHPHGIWFTTWTPPRMPPPTRWDYEEILARESA
ncbi:hypothetical protein AU196_24320 [Mycobacterium sp. IS-1742]|uniref:Coq4 family protein n=1 Tax=Mycobacterium sp. IS-1742 TaxID=1772285 RepID=UPI0007404D8C|nr:Coq4 family protein [Mycobacterium sp. IS-1742]KUI30917.1 hypothetical protein AU196_24320 [Mycobacterium sp. IS-1742]